MNKKISFKDLDGWLKTVVIFAWIRIGLTIVAILALIALFVVVN